VNVFATGDQIPTIVVTALLPIVDPHGDTSDMNKRPSLPIYRIG
jgi:hypothetical protein